MRNNHFLKNFIQIRFNFSIPAIILFSLLISLPTLSLKAQESDDVQDVFRISLLTPGFSVEKRVGKNQVLYGSIYTRLSLLLGVKELYTSNNSGIMGSTTEPIVKLFVDPALFLQYRYYYNLQKRSGAGKNILNNSGNYIAPAYRLIYSKVPMPGIYSTYSDNITLPAPIKDFDISAKKRPVNMAGVLWGLSRTYDNIFLDLNVGLGYMFTNSEYEISLTDFQDRQYVQNIGKKSEGFIAMMGEFLIGIKLGK